MTDLAQLLTAAERERKSPNVRPKDAATLILVDRSGPTPKVLLGKRHHGHSFMPGKFVFPGGRVDPSDRLMPVAKSLNTHAEQFLMRKTLRPSATKARAIALKEERAELTKHHLMVLWADFFTAEHREQFSNLDDLFWRAIHQAGDAKKSVDPEDGRKLIALIDEIADIFWQTEKAKTMGVYPVAGSTT